MIVGGSRAVGAIVLLRAEHPVLLGDRPDLIELRESPRLKNRGAFQYPEFHYLRKGPRACRVFEPSSARARATTLSPAHDDGGGFDSAI